MEETTEKLASAVNNGGNFYFMVFYYILALLLIVGGMFFVRKYLMKNAKKIGGVKSGAYMKIIDRLVIAQDKQIILIEAGNKLIAVGISPQNIGAIAEFSKEEFGDLPADADGAGADGGGFLNLLSKKLNFRDGGKNEKNNKE